MDTQTEGKIDSMQASKSLKKWTVPIIAIAAASGALVFTAFYTLNKASSAQQIDSALVKPKPPESISSLGRLEPEGEVLKVAPPSALGSSRIVKLLVKEGDTVKQGQPLAVLDSYDRSKIAVAQAEAKVGEREASLAQVRAGAKSGDIQAQKANLMAKKASKSRLTLELANAESDLKRYEALLKDGATTEITRDGFAIKVKSLTEQIAQVSEEINQAEASLSSVSEVRSVDVEVAQAQLNTARADVDRAKADLALAEVQAPIDGQVIKIHAKTGEVVSNTDGLLELGNTGQMYAVAEVYETDIIKVKAGQKATITSEAFKGEITGVVDRIGLRIAKNDVLGTDPAAKTDVRVIEVKIRLDDSTKVASLTNLQVKIRIKLV